MTLFRSIPWININMFRMQTTWAMIPTRITKLRNLFTTILTYKFFIYNNKIWHYFSLMLCLYWPNNNYYFSL